MPIINTYETLLTDEASTTVTYIGYAMNAGADPAAPVWAIMKITASSATPPVGVTTYLWATGVPELFSNVWDNRASLTYA